jgi:hypothetical protein
VKKILHLKYLLPAALLFLLAVKPVALPVRAQGSIDDFAYYLPIMLGSGDPVSDGTLNNGGAVEGPDGVGIGALADSLDAPVQVSIAAVSQPSTGVPAPAQVVGGYYAISAGQDVYVSPASPLILAFPIPAGTGTGNLALALLRSGAGASDADPDAQDWTFLEGMVDHDRNLFLTTIAGLKQDGLVSSLVEHPDFESPPNDGSAEPTLVDSRSAQTNLFLVNCVAFLLPNDCTAVTEIDAANYLNEIYDRIHTDLGYPQPRLRYWHGSLAYLPNSIGNLGYMAYIEPTWTRFCQGADGYYEHLSGRLVLCYDPSIGFSTSKVQAIIHEYFHATQYAYLEVLADWFDRSEEPWVIEGMAASVMESYFYDEMVRYTGYGSLHIVDISLEHAGAFSEIDEYLAQDFWVYYGQKNGLDMTYLKTILERGSTSQVVVDILGDGEYLEAYWDWAKNQAMEAQVDFDGALATPCELELDTVGLLEEAEFGSYSNTFYDIPPLDALTSIVVDLRWDSDGYNFFSGWVFPTPLTGQDDAAAREALRFKFYVEGEVGCEAVPDGGRMIENPDPSKRYYLVISNIDHDAAYQYRIGFEYSPYRP